MTGRQRKVLAGEALIASVKFANDLVGVVDLMDRPAMLSALNASATITTMRARIAAMVRFVDSIDERGNQPCG